MIGMEGVQGLAAGLGEQLLSNLLLPLCERTVETGVVENGRQLTDVLTKPLGRLRLTELKKMIGMEGVQELAAGLREELLSNLLLPLCERTAGTDGAEKGSLLLHCSSCRGRRQSQPCCHI